MADSNDKLREILMVVAKAAISAKAPFLGVLDLGAFDISEGLLKLVNFDYLTDLKLDELTGLTETALKKKKQLLDDTLVKIQEAVTRAQTFSAGLLTTDGIFGLKTVNWIRFARRCHGKLHRPDSATAAGLPDGAKGLLPYEYIYFIEALPETSGFNPRTELESAWISWMTVCGVVGTETRNRQKANVIVKVVDIDGPGSVLADAHIGPHPDFVLDLRIDKGEIWEDRRKFRAAICHEIGHLIGLGHTDTPSQLMNETVGTIEAPSDEDKRIASEKWGPSKYQKPKDDDPIV